MGGSDDEGEPQVGVDMRMSWFQNRVCGTLNLKPEKFNDMDEVRRHHRQQVSTHGVRVQPQESLFPFKDFLDTTDCMELYISLGERDRCLAS